MMRAPASVTTQLLLAAVVVLAPLNAAKAKGMLPMCSPCGHASVVCACKKQQGDTSAATKSRGDSAPRTRHIRC